MTDVDDDHTITSIYITYLYNYLLNGDDAYVTTSDIDGDGYVTSDYIKVIHNLNSFLNPKFLQK